MTDNSNLVLRWEIDNARATLATGKAESGVFDEGGFKWTIAAEKRSALPNDLADFTLRCDVNHNGSWKCEAEVDIDLLGHDPYNIIKKKRFVINEVNRSLLHNSLMFWRTMNMQDHNIGDKITFEIRIQIVGLEGPIADPGELAAPNCMSNVILTIGEKKLYVLKELLALHSPFFKTLFFGDFAEKGKDEVEIKDVVYEEFVDLLHIIYLGTTKISDRTLRHILKLADQFQMKRVLDLSTEHLTQSGGFTASKKLLLADHYRLVSLRDHCLQSFTNLNEMKQQLMSSAEFDDYSDDTKARICERVKILMLQ